MQARRWSFVLMTDVEAPRADADLMRGTATLIAADGAREAIAEILYAQGLETTAFDRVEDVPDGAGHDDPSVAVLWVKDTSSLAQVLRPLRQLFERTPVVVGYMNSQIAERLFLAESTVKSHLSSAFGKLGVRHDTRR